jgi:hypothetical protein
MTEFKSAGGAGRGLWPEDMTGITMRNRHSAALVKGDIVMVDELNSAAVSGATFTPGGDLSVLAAVVRPNTAGIAAGCQFMVSEGSCAVGAWGRFTLKSNDVLCSIEGALATAVTDLLSPQNGTLTLDQNNTGSETTQVPIIARVIEAQADTVHTAATVLTRCRFDGTGGFNLLAASA